MSLGLAFWIGMFIWLIFGLYTNRANFRVAAPDLLLFILLVLLGWKVFGAPLHG